MYFSKVILVCFLILPSLLVAKIVSVQVKQTTLHSKPSFISKSILKLHYAQKVDSRKVENSWHQVKLVNSSKSGWIHESALSDKVIKINSSKRVSTTSVSQSEVMMAGKGFNKDVEKEYKKQNKNLNFKLVDKIENSKVQTKKELIRFAKEGKLNL